MDLTLTGKIEQSRMSKKLGHGLNRGFSDLFFPWKEQLSFGMSFIPNASYGFSPDPPSLTDIATRKRQNGYIVTWEIKA
jgi:hypothetical protein